MSLRRILVPVVPLAVVAALIAPGGSASAEPSAPEPTPGGWDVVPLGGGRYDVSWTADTRLPMTSDRPTIVGEGLTFGVPTLSADGRTVSAVVTAPTAPDATALDVVLSGDRLDEAGFDPGAAEPVAPAAPSTSPLDAPDPGLPGPFATVTSDYDIEPLPVAGMREPIEMVGHVVEPAPDAATGPRPLVLFLHGRHSVCYDPDDPDAYGDDWPCRAPFQEIPSHLGYDYIQRVLASQGYATVSIRVNGINAQDWRLGDGGADARAEVVEAHLDHWAAMAVEHQLDLTRVVLVGHSRGGEGVDRAAIQIPESAPYDLAGQVLLAPTDFAYHTAPHVPTVTVLPYCDGDVYDLQGQRFTDVARDIDRDDTALKSSVLVLGANHNFFNTEWTPGVAAAPSWDDAGGLRGACARGDDDRLSAATQRRAGKAYVAAAVHLFTGEPDYLPAFDGSAVAIPSAYGSTVLSHAIGGGRALRRIGSEARPSQVAGTGYVRLCQGAFGNKIGVCGRNLREWGDVAPHWVDGWNRGAPTRTFLEFGWSAAGTRGGVRLTSPLDVSSGRLEIRTIADLRLPVPELQVRLTDGAGASVVVAPEVAPAAFPRTPDGVRLWAQSLIVDPADATGIDLATLRSVELVAGTERGRLWIADLAAAPETMATAPTDRLPQVSVGETKVVEGSGGPTQVGVPFTIAGDVSEPGRFRVVVAGGSGATTMTVDVEPGQTAGTIPLEYVADDIDGPTIRSSIRVYPLAGLTTDDYLGRLVVTDDDPAPKVTVEPVSKVVAEGGRVTFKVKLDGDTLTSTFVYASIANADGDRDLRASDVPAAWLARHAEKKPDGDPPLHKCFVYLFERLRPLERTVTLSMPIRADRVREGREKVSFVIQVGRRQFTRTVTVVDAAG